MIWDRTRAIGLAAQGCTYCFGLGLRDRRGVEVPCKCVLRAIFRACYRKFEVCVTTLPKMTTGAAHQSLRNGNGRNHSAACGEPKRSRYGYPNSEYIADFLVIAKRTLTEAEHKIFTWHHLLGADFRLVNRKLGRPIGERETFHDFYRIEEALGRAFAETLPYGLFPLDEYFGGTVRGTIRTAPIEPEPERNSRLRVPLRTAAA